MTSVNVQDITTITTLQLNDKLLGERVAGTTRQLSFTKISDSAAKPLLEFTAVASAVNNVILSNNSTTLNPSIGATGSDTNISIDFLSKGSGSINLKSTSASAVKISSGTGYQHTTILSVPTTAASRTVTIPDSDFTVAGTTVALSGTGKSSFTAYTPICGGTTTTGNLQSVASAGTAGYPLVSGGAAALPSYSANPTLSTIVDSNGNELLSFSAVGSAVNNIVIANAIAGDHPIIQATGDSANIDLDLCMTGTGSCKIVSANTTTPLRIYNGTSFQHQTQFVMSNTAATRLVTFPDYSFTFVGTTAAGSTGQILQSGGGSVNTWSTPTYPSASGTSRKILVSDGTNNVYSTETYAVPGTSGKVMQSDGTNWTSATPTGTGTPVLATTPTITTPSLITPTIDDANGNELVRFSSVGSAVNYIAIANSITGDFPVIQATGSDTNIDLDLYQKGTGSLKIVSGNLTTPLRIYNGTSFQHQTQFVMSNTAATRLVTFPDASGTVSLLGNSSTGSGSVVLATSPTLTTPVLGAATATSINFGGSSLGTYVIGTYTPTLYFGAGNTGITYSTNTGIYTRVGDLVTFSIAIVLTSKGSSTGTATIVDALPIATKSGSISQTWNILVENLTTTTTPVITYAPTNSTTITPLRLQNPGASSVITDTGFANNTGLYITGSYVV